MRVEQPSWDHYRTFFEVLRTGSFSAAARKLGVRQSTVSRQVEALEATLDVKLFTRSQRGLVPTDAAQRLRPHLTVLDATTEAMARDVLDAESANVATIRITTSETIAFEIVPRVLPELRALLPLVKVEVSISDDFEDLLAREADIAIRSAKSQQRVVVQKRVGELEMGLFATRAYLRGKTLPATPADLEQHALIGYDRDVTRIRALQKRLPVFEREHFTYLTDRIHLHKVLVDTGCGIGFCMVDAARRDRIRVLPDDYALRFSVWVAMHEDLKGRRVYRRFYNELARLLQAAFRA